MSTISSGLKSVANKTARFAAEETPALTQSVVTTPSVGDVVTISAPKPQKRSVINSVLWPFTKLGQALMGAGRLAVNSVRSVLTGITNAVKGFFRKQPTATSVKPLDTLQPPVEAAIVPADIKLTEPVKTTKPVEPSPDALPA